MRLAAIVTASSLVSCSLLNTRYPDPPPYTARPVCDDSYRRPLGDAAIAAAGLAAIGLGAFAFTQQGTYDAGNPIAIGAVLTVGGAGVAGLFGTSAGLGYSRVTSCIEAVSQWEQEEAVRVQLANEAAERDRKAALALSAQVEEQRQRENAEAAEKNRQEAERIRQATERAEAEANARKVVLNQLVGFQKAEWGMNEAAVSKLFPGGRVSGDRAKRMMSIEREVAGLTATVLFIFDGLKRLTEVQISFDQNQRGFADWRQVCDAVTKALEEKYGDGAASDEVIQSYSVHWRGAKTLVQLDCSGIAIWPKKSVTLYYSDRAFEEAKPDVKPGDL